MNNFHLAHGNSSKKKPPTPTMGSSADSARGFHTGNRPSTSPSHCRQSSWGHVDTAQIYQPNFSFDIPIPQALNDRSRQNSWADIDILEMLDQESPSAKLLETLEPLSECDSEFENSTSTFEESNLSVNGERNNRNHSPTSVATPFQIPSKGFPDKKAPLLFARGQVHRSGRANNKS